MSARSMHTKERRANNVDVRQQATPTLADDYWNFVFGGIAYSHGDKSLDILEIPFANLAYQYVSCRRRMFFEVHFSIPTFGARASSSCGGNTRVSRETFKLRKTNNLPTR